MTNNNLAHIIGKTYITLSDGLYEMLVVSYAGKPWLVPGWIDIPRPGYSRPERLVHLTNIPLQQTEGVFFLTCSSVPRSVFYDPIPTPASELYEVLFQPHLEFETHSVGPVH